MRPEKELSWWWGWRSEGWQRGGGERGVDSSGGVGGGIKVVKEIVGVKLWGGRVEGNSRGDGGKRRLNGGKVDGATVTDEVWVMELWLKMIGGRMILLWFLGMLRAFR